MTREDIAKLGWQFQGKHITEQFTMNTAFDVPWENYTMRDIRLTWQPDVNWVKIEAVFGGGAPHETIFDGEIDDIERLRLVMCIVGLQKTYAV